MTNPTPLALLKDQFQNWLAKTLNGPAQALIDCGDWKEKMEAHGLSAQNATLLEIGKVHQTTAVTLKNLYWPSTLRFHNSQFIQALTIVDSSIGGLTFGACNFQNQVRLENTTIGEKERLGALSFENCTFPSHHPLSLSGASTSLSISCEHGNAPPNLKILKSTLGTFYLRTEPSNRGADFEEVNFLSDFPIRAISSMSNFSASTRAINCEFQKGILESEVRSGAWNFLNSAIHGPLKIRTWTVNDTDKVFSISLEGCRLSNSVNLAVHGNKPLNLTKASFSDGPKEKRSITSNNKIILNEAKVIGDLSLAASETEVCGTNCEASLSFKGHYGIKISETTIKGTCAVINEVHPSLSSGLKIDKNSQIGLLTFSEADIEGPISIEDSRIKGVDISGSGSFLRAVVLKNLQTEEFNSSNRTYLSTLSFNNVTFKKAPRFFSTKLHHDTQFSRCTFKDRSGQTENAYRTLKHLMAGIGNTYQEQFFGSLEVESRHASISQLPERVVSFLYKLANNYGQSFLMGPLCWIFGFFVLSYVFIYNPIEKTWMGTDRLRLAPRYSEELRKLASASPDLSKEVWYWNYEAEDCSKKHFVACQKAWVFSAVNTLGPLRLLPQLDTLVPRTGGVELWSLFHAFAATLFWYLAGAGVRRRFKTLE